MSKIKIGDTVVYSPSLNPIICEVRGIMGNYITVRDCDGVVATKPASDFCSVTEEELKRLKEIMKQEKEAH